MDQFTHSHTTLSNDASEPPVSEGALPGLSEEDRHALLFEISGPAYDPTLIGDGIFHEIFEAQADRYPQNTALWCNGQTMTYEALDRAANQLARYLRAQGAGPGRLVAILLPRSMDVSVALLGVLKSGAAYVPLDPDYPADRISYILGDCHVHAVITTSALSERLATLVAAANPASTPTSDPSESSESAASEVRSESTASEPAAQPYVILLDTQADLLGKQSIQRLSRKETGVQSIDLAYVIYTSGSTGRPKGVQIEHRSACNLVGAESRIFDVGPTDRVYQGFSVAFDAAVEEFWLAWAAGATLVVGTTEMVRSGPALPGLLTKAGVTILSCVPTLLSMMEDDIPSVRLLIVGGEVCAADLVRRWCRPGRRMVNTYGPTEATVIATYGDCTPNKPVTIGRAVPNYRIYILNPEMQPVPVGDVGELHIGGVSLARGYLGRPDLTAEKFVADPFGVDGPGGRLYKTGDLARFNADGEIEFMGRADTQVKIRGFRVELSEIESVLMQCPEVLGAAVTVRQDLLGMQQLIGYIVPRGGAIFNEDSVRQQLSDRLPKYMVPALLETVVGLPTLPCGKVDRSRLPAPRVRAAKTIRTTRTFENRFEQKLAELWQELFQPLTVSPHDDFFTELGGHSLLAATMVSRLRKDPDFHDISVSDVYRLPTVQLLAAEFQSRRQNARDNGAAVSTDSSGAPCQNKETPKPFQPPRLAHAICSIAQTLTLYPIVAFYGIQWMLPYIAYCSVADAGDGFWAAAGVAILILEGTYPLVLLLSILAKWTIIGRFKPGEYPVWGWYFFRWWLVTRIVSCVPVDYLAGTPLLGFYYRWMGAKIGPRVYFGTDAVGIFDLLSIGEETSIGQDASMLGYTIEDGLLKIGCVSIGKRCFVGARAMLSPNVVMEDDARLGEMSLLPEGARLPRGETWSGSPARLSSVASDGQTMCGWSDFERFGPVHHVVYGFLYILGVLVLPAVYLLAVLPGLYLLNYLGRVFGDVGYLLASPLVAVSFVVLLCLEIALVKWVLQGRVRPGRYPLESWFYFRKWFVDQLMDISLDLLGPLYASLYLAPWYRLLGAKVGKNAEISTACATSPDQLTLGDGSFIADCVSLGVSRVDHGAITIAPTWIGKQAFIGNSALVPGGSVIGDDTLVGVLSMTPTTKPGAEQPSTSWLGSPAIFLPQRQVSTTFSAESTYKPTRRLYCIRATIEFFRIISPVTFFVVMTCALISTMSWLSFEYSETLAWLLFGGIGSILIVVMAKWGLMGRFVPSEKPLWSTFVWRNELLTALHENFANPFLVELLAGTFWLCCFFRLLGAKIGRRVCLESTQLTEFDLVTIGDDAAINLDCTVQTHLFEDRVMKMSTVNIGPRCSTGAGAVVLYDSQLEEGSTLLDLSLVMKGESLPADTRWEGSPARPAAN
jgi:non-ribosomal peptide synthetase-like protein